MKRSILITILFLTIGFATISTTLLISGNTSIGINENDFNVYFSNAFVNGVKNWNVIKSDQEISFSATMKSKNEQYVLDYDVTNGSKNYDAKIEINCTGGNEYLSVNNDFDTNNNLLARETRSGKLTVTLRKQYTGDSLETEVKCTITADGVERTELNEIEVPTTISKYYIGKEIAIGEEKFNVISQTDDTVTLFAKQNLNSSFRQEQSENYVSFSNSTSWEFMFGPLDLDIQSYDGNAKTFVNEYVSYLQNETGDTSISGTLITLSELADLECSVVDDYLYRYSGTCEGSSYADWLSNGYSYWTRSAVSDDNAMAFSLVWSVSPLGEFEYGYNEENGIRPTITISKGGLEDYFKYKVGNEIKIGTEKFNVISSDSNSVKLLAKNVLDVDYKQEVNVDFFDSNIVFFVELIDVCDAHCYNNFEEVVQWEYAPGPKEVDVYTWSPDISRHLNGYKEYLETIIENDDFGVDLISVTELGNLGCTIDSTYSTGGEYTCRESINKDWLIIEPYWWTKSTIPEYSRNIFTVIGNPQYSAGEAGDIAFFDVDYNFGVRPVITVSKTIYDKFY